MNENPIHVMTPTSALQADERVIESFLPDRATYWRDHAWLAAAAMVLGMIILWLMGNPHVWTGAVGGLAAIAVRAFYVASDELKARWDLTDRRLLGPQTRAVRLSEIAAVRGLGSAVQVVTASGDKHLIKYQADRTATEARIRAATGRG
ncbi:hypothetical protein [Roseovarius autotrophicus]|uniref:hypothetical protein n=1 Tax=Roseovarius autotrophicus TaxID=2824121 RepID=UPI0019E13181|nr:hypothetical protein [Roseovarius autotrophicus]MBE0453712.1 hypothetical protein [Roseovarius sp.]